MEIAYLFCQRNQIYFIFISVTLESTGSIAVNENRCLRNFHLIIILLIAKICEMIPLLLWENFNWMPQIHFHFIILKKKLIVSSRNALFFFNSIPPIRSSQIFMENSLKFNQNRDWMRRIVIKLEMKISWISWSLWSMRH